MTASQLDSRAWLAWGLATMLPVLIGRNPWLLLEVLVVVLAVRATWRPRVSPQGMGWFLRLAAVFLAVSVVFNVLTVHAGEGVIFTLPDVWPVIGGDITWNALAWGVASALVLFTLVVTGTTVASLIHWVDLFHALPARLAPIAVTGSVAWAFLPQTAVAWRQIREAQLMRGHRFRGARDLVPIVVPLLAGGLERSLVMAEALEARGFGRSHTGPAPSRSGWRDAGVTGLLVASLTGLATAGFSLAVGRPGWAAVASAVAALALIVLVRTARPSGDGARTRYRPPRWTTADSLVSLAAAFAAMATLCIAVVRPAALAWEVYPEVMFAPVELLLMLPLALLLAPAALRTSGAQPT